MTDDAPRPTDEKGSYRGQSDEFLKQWDWSQGENFIIKGIAGAQANAKSAGKGDVVEQEVLGTATQSE